MSRNDWTMAGRWTIAIFDPDGEQDDFQGIDSVYGTADNEDPFANVVEWYSADEGWSMVAERFVEAGMQFQNDEGETIFGFRLERRARAWTGERWVKVAV